MELLKARAKGKISRAFKKQPVTVIPSQTLPQPDSQPFTRPTSQSPPRPPPPNDLDISPLPTLQERLWNRAYDDLKVSEPELVETYEKILSAKLHEDKPASASNATVLTNNEIGTSQETRRNQMRRLVQAGLDRTQRQVSIKQGIDEGLQVVQTVKEIVSKAVQASPEAAVAWVGVCFGLEILSNPVAEARENRNGIAYVLSRMEWYWNLASLLLAENKAEQSLAELQAQLENHIVQLYGKLLSFQMKSISLYYRNWIVGILRDVFKFDDWAGQRSEIQEAETAVQRDMEQYNTEASKKQLMNIANSANAMETNLQKIHSAIQNQTQQQDKWRRDDKYEKCMQDLRETDPRDDKTRIQATKGGLLRDSYCWILNNDQFQQWRDDPKNRLLWIKGDPGKGKTMLLCGIIDELEKESDNCLAYFFCQATEARLRNATAVLRGLIYSLVDQLPPLVSHVRGRYDRAGKQLFEDGNAWEALSKILGAMLNDPSLDGAILVIDALDECETNRDRLLDFIMKPSYVKWIISSRNWPQIEQKFDNTKQEVRLHLEHNKDSISEAVVEYIRYKVKKLASLKKYDEETSDAVKSHLISHADGTFLWVALVCQELEDPKVVRKRHTLERLESFPSGLDPLYKRMIGKISDSSDAEICKEILAIASVVYRPITLEELKVLVGSLKHDDYDDLPQIIGSCGSFLTLQEGAVYFVHQSAKDFLLNPKVSGQILPSGIAHQHYTLFLKSLAALLQSLRRDIYNLGAPGFRLDEVVTPDPDPLSSIRYSCIYWAYHLHGSDPTMIKVSLQDNGKVHEFIKEKFLHWLESLSLLGKMSEGVRIIQKLESSAKDTGAQQLAALFQDARRFIFSHRQPIEMAPLQAYASAIVFSPEHSLIRNLFSGEPQWMRLKPKMEAQWNSCLQTLEGHSSLVESVTFLPDGQRLASSSCDNTVKIWDTTTGTCLQTLEGRFVAFLLDSQRLASHSHDNTLKIWDTTTGKCLQTLQGHGSSVLSVAFSSVDQLLVSGSADKTVKIWDTTTGTCLQTLNEHSGSVMPVVFSVNGNYIASSSQDETVKIWNSTTGMSLQTIKGHGKWATINLSPDGKYLASGSQDNTVKIWDTTTGTCLKTFEGSVKSMAFSPDSQHLASGSDDNTVKIWDTTTGACLQTLKGHSRIVYSVAFSPDSQCLASGSGDDTVKIWDTTIGTCLQTLKGHSSTVVCVAFSPDSQYLASSSLDNTVKIWDTAIGACPQTLQDHRGKVESVTFSSNGQYLASGSDDDTVKIWDPTTGACLQTLEGHSTSVYSVTFSPDSLHLASSSLDNTVKIWDTTTGTCLQTLEGHSKYVVSVTFSLDSQCLASGSDDNTVKIWDTTTGTCLQTLKGHSSTVVCVAFSQDSQYLASGSWYNTMIWDITTGTCLQTLKGYSSKVYSLAVSPDGQCLALGTWDIIRIWDMTTGTCLQTLEGHRGNVVSVAFSPDGQYLASGSWDDIVKIWDMTTGTCLQTLHVEATLSHLSFDSLFNATSYSQLSTDIGLLNLACPSTKEIVLEDISRSGYDISTDLAWIVKDGKNMLWIPAEFRPGALAVKGSKIAIGCHSGRMLVMEFS